MLLLAINTHGFNGLRSRALLSQQRAIELLPVTTLAPEWILDLCRIAITTRRALLPKKLRLQSSGLLTGYPTTRRRTLFFQDESLLLFNTNFTRMRLIARLVRWGLVSDGFLFNIKEKIRCSDGYSPASAISPIAWRTALS